jgi:hypothetical protein
MNTNQKGEIAQLRAELRAAEKGVLVSKPTRADARYDLILDEDGTLSRMQVKYADAKSSHSSGVVLVRLDRRMTNASRKLRCYTRKEIDGVLAYVPAVDRMIRLGIEQFDGKWSVHVRLKPPLNNQRKGILFAEDFYW